MDTGLIFVAIGCWLAIAQAPTECKAVTHWGISGCEISAKGECPKGYHEGWACPPNPAMKAPCYRMCVADAPSKNDAPKEDGRPRS